MRGPHAQWQYSECTCIQEDTKGKASLRRYERLQKRQKSSSSSGTDTTDESIGHKQQHQVSQGKFSKRFTGIYHIFHNFMSLKNSSVVSS